MRTVMLPSHMTWAVRSRSRGTARSHRWRTTMRVFITGASGWIGTALTKELVAAGHEVVGLARSEASAQRIVAVGGSTVRGDMQDHDLIVAQAAKADAVAHLAFTLDFAQF